MALYPTVYGVALGVSKVSIESNDPQSVSLTSVPLPTIFPYCVQYLLLHAGRLTSVQSSLFIALNYTLLQYMYNLIETFLVTQSLF